VLRVSAFVFWQVAFRLVLPADWQAYSELRDASGTDETIKFPDVCCWHVTDMAGPARYVRF
jgi:hypothetical protein